MLSADELGCLALRWGVQLKILFRSGEFYETHQEDNPTLIHVILCNPSQNNWQVYYENRKEQIKDIDSGEDGLTPLIITTLNRDQEVVAKFFEKGADVNQARKDGTTPLMIAAQMLEKGTDVNRALKAGKEEEMIQESVQRNRI